MNRRSLLVSLGGFWAGVAGLFRDRGRVRYGVLSEAVVDEWGEGVGSEPTFCHWGMGVVGPEFYRDGGWTLARAGAGADRWRLVYADTGESVHARTGHSVVWADCKAGVYCCVEDTPQRLRGTIPTQYVLVRADIRLRRRDPTATEMT
jgi:hypothetical protein